MTGNDEEECYALDHVQASVAALSDADLLRLKMSATGYAWGAVAPDDLLQEALVRILSGKRRWPKRVPFKDFLNGVMKSIVSDENRDWISSNVSAIGGDQELESIAGTEGIPDQSEYVAAEQGLEQVEALFADDEEAGLILASRAEGDSREEICEALQMDERQYATALRRIRRKLAHSFPAGSQCNE